MPKITRWLLIGLVLAAGVGHIGTSVAFTDQSPRDQAMPTPPVGTASIAGRVVILIDRQLTPVRRALVTLQSDGAAPVATDTDTDGRYRLDRLPAGVYRVVIDKPGFVPVLQGTRHAFDPPGSFDLKAEQALTMDVEMQRGAALEGRVVNDSGEPVVNFAVSAVRLTYGPHGKRPSLVRQAMTDDLGRYRIHTLPAGDYYIDAALDPKVVTGPITQVGGTGFARTYYPGTPRLEEARAVSVSVGQDLDRLDFTLTSVPLAKITGSVIDSAGSPVANAGPVSDGAGRMTLPPPMMTVRLQAVGFSSVPVMSNTPMGRSEFGTAVVPPGDYWLMATVLSPSGGPPEFGVQRLSVNGQDLANVTIATGKSAVVTGHVEVDGRTSVVPANLQVLSFPTEFDLPTPPGGPAVGAPANVGADGSFTLNGVFGPGVVQLARLPVGWAVKSVWLGDREITDAPVDFKPTPDPQSLRIVITQGLGAVSGVLQNEQGRPVGASRVVIFGHDDQEWGARSRFIKSVEAGADGRFSLDGLLPGDYFIAATDYLEDGSWMDPDVLWRLKPAALPVTVTAGQRLTVTLRVR